MLEPAPAPRAPFPGVGHAVLLLVLLWSVLLVVAAALSLAFGVVGFAGVGGDLVDPSRMAMLLIVGNSVAFVVVTFFGWKLSRTPARTVFPFRRFAPGLLFPVAVAAVGTLLLAGQADSAFRLLPLPPGIEAFMSDLDEALAAMFQRAFWPSLVAAVVMAPLTEEVFFRGLLLHGFLGRYGRRAAILLSAFFFAVAHLTPNQLVVAFGAGILLGWLLARSGNLWFPLFAHAFFNSQPAIAAKLMGPEAATQVPSLEPGLMALGAVLLALGVMAFHRFCPREGPSVAGVPHVN